MNTSCGHHWQVKVQPPLDETDVNDIDKWYQDIQCALMSVDDIVGEVVALLTERKQLDNSYFLCVCELSSVRRSSLICIHISLQLHL